MIQKLRYQLQWIHRPEAGGSLVRSIARFTYQQSRRQQDSGGNSDAQQRTCPKHENFFHDGSPVSMAEFNRKKYRCVKHKIYSDHQSNVVIGNTRSRKAKNIQPRFFAAQQFLQSPDDQRQQHETVCPDDRAQMSQKKGGHGIAERQQRHGNVLALKLSAIKIRKGTACQTNLYDFLYFHVFQQVLIRHKQRQSRERTCQIISNKPPVASAHSKRL